MRIGLNVNEMGVTLDGVVAGVRAAAEAGLAGAWLPQRPGGWDALATLAVAGREVPGIPLGTAIVPTYPRHPIVLATQALTTQAATGNRLTLGVGTSHRFIVEDQFGLSFERPARHLREYLTALLPLLHGESVSYRGETLAATGKLLLPGAEPPSVLVGALGPAMLRIAGELADGTVTVWAGPRALADHVVPTLTRATGGRPEPRVVAFAIVGVTADPDARRGEIARRLGRAGTQPSYRAILDREGAAGPADTAILGDETAVAAGLRRLADAGATEVVALPLVDDPAEQALTMRLLGELNSAG
jgi:F420-dependent oxidoreductase-like protein